MEALCRTPAQRAQRAAAQILQEAATKARAHAGSVARSQMVRRLVAADEHAHLQVEPSGTRGLLLNVRRELSSRHPGARFFVFGNAAQICVRWQDGPTTLMVAHSLRKFAQHAGSASDVFQELFGCAAKIDVRRSVSAALLCKAVAIAFESQGSVLRGVPKPSAATIQHGQVPDNWIEALGMGLRELVMEVAEGLVGI